MISRPLVVHPVVRRGVLPDGQNLCIDLAFGSKLAQLVQVEVTEGIRTLRQPLAVGATAGIALHELPRQVLRGPYLDKRTYRGALVIGQFARNIWTQTCRYKTTVLSGAPLSNRSTSRRLASNNSRRTAADSRRVQFLESDAGSLRLRLPPRQIQALGFSVVLTCLERESPRTTSPRLLPRSL